ncbi:MAG: DUF7453 family protein, partial [Roseimicrobium sp.]
AWRRPHCAGIITSAGGSPVSNIAKWNGTSWSAMGTGELDIQTLTVFGGEVYYGGGSGLRKWNGSSWVAVGGTTFGIKSLASSADKLFACGEFTEAGGVPASGIAAWDGSAWTALGSGLNWTLFGPCAVATDGTRVYAGGGFSYAGGKVSGSFAEYGPPRSTFGSDVRISDEFDDGAPATNTAGVGHGFVKRGQAASTESGGFLNLNNESGASTRVYTSNTSDAFNPFAANLNATVLKTTYGAINQGTGIERVWLGYRVSGSTSDHFYPVTNGPASPKVQGLYISILQQSSDTAYPRHGNLVAVSNTGVEKKLATWDWSNVNSLSGLVVTLTTTATHYSLSFSGAAGAVPVNVTGALSGVLSGLGPITTNFDVGLFSQFFGGTGAGVRVNSILLRAIPPSPITAPTYSMLNSANAILGGNASAINGPITARGVVISRLSQNGNPEIGGTNVSQIAAGSGSGIFTVNVTGLLPGETYVFRSYVITASGTAYTEVVTFTAPLDSDPITMSVAASGAPVPGAGLIGSGIPTGATWTLFGPPAVNDSSQVAFLGSYKSSAVTGKGLFVDDTQVVAVGASVPGLPGVTIKALFDPLIDSAGHVTFRATLGGTGVTLDNDNAFLTNSSTGTLRVLIREGDQAVGAPAGAVWGTLQNVAVPGGPMQFLLTGQLLTGPNNTPGPGGVTQDGDLGLWATDSTGSVKLLFLEGFTVGTKTLKSFQVLATSVASQGSARSFNRIGTVTWRATYTDNTTEILTTQVQ